MAIDWVPAIPPSAYRKFREHSSSHLLFAIAAMLRRMIAKPNSGNFENSLIIRCYCSSRDAIYTFEKLILANSQYETLTKHFHLTRWVLHINPEVLERLRHCSNNLALSHVRSDKRFLNLRLLFIFIYELSKFKLKEYIHFLIEFHFHFLQSRLKVWFLFKVTLSGLSSIYLKDS
jgi:hypothetical protein